jgi:triphosphoribosyl-dephospho-CoA synthase
MALAADRDRIAAQYRDAAADLFDIGLANLDAAQRRALFSPEPDASAQASMAQIAAVQRVFLAFLASAPDSHIVRKKGALLAHSVMNQAGTWLARAQRGEVLDLDPAFAAWDETLKADGVNPGTSADMTVTTLMLAGLVG